MRSDTRNVSVAGWPGTAVLAAGLALQAGLGLSRRDWYLDDAWVKSTWLGNDAVTLFVVLPLVVASWTRARQGSPRALVLCTGLIAYCAYNYAFYLLGATLNVFFPLYVGLVLLSAYLLAKILLQVEPAADGYTRGVATRSIAAWLVVVGLVLGCVWLAIWGRHVFLGAPTPVTTEAFRLVAALDLTIVTPALVTTGVLLWRGRPWGYVGGAIAAIASTAYLLVLSVNAALAWSGGTTAARQEALVWITATMSMLSAAVVLCRAVESVRHREVSS